MLSGVRTENPDLKVMYGDESFFRSETPLTHTWGDRKQRKSVKASSHQGTVAVIGAIDPKIGDHHEIVFDTPIDSESVNEFLKSISLKYEKEKLLLIMDNASYHKTQGSIKYPMPKNISIMFLPPYCPDLNPQENVWKSVKEKEFKNVLCRNVAELNKNVIKAFSRFKNHKFIFPEF